MSTQPDHRGSSPSVPKPSFTVDALALEIGARVEGDGTVELEGIRPLGTAGPRDLSFLHAASYLEKARQSSAAALIVPGSLVGQLAEDRPLLVPGEGLSGSSKLALARALAVLYPQTMPAAGIHPTAVVAADAEVDPSAHLGPYVVVGEGSHIGPNVVLEAHVVIGRGCLVGAGSRLHPGVVLYDATCLGERVEIHGGAVLGADGFGYATVGGTHHKVPQVGRVVVAEDVEIGANSTVDRALLDETRIGTGTKIDNLVHLGHNVETGQGCILCGQAGIAGSTILGDYVVLGGQTGVIDHVRLGSGVQVASKSAVYGNIEAGSQVGGIPAIDLKAYRRQVAVTNRLPEISRRLRRLEKELEALEKAGKSPQSE